MPYSIWVFDFDSMELSSAIFIFLTGNTFFFVQKSVGKCKTQNWLCCNDYGLILALAKENRRPYSCVLTYCYFPLFQNERKLLTFYLPKILIVAPIWTSAVILATWEKVNAMKDPTYDHKFDTQNFEVCFFVKFGLFILLLIFSPQIN